MVGVRRIDDDLDVVAENAGGHQTTTTDVVDGGRAGSGEHGSAARAEKRGCEVNDVAIHQSGLVERRGDGGTAFDQHLQHALAPR